MDISGPSSSVGDRYEETISVRNAADAFLKSFDAHGVEYVFNSPGSEYAPFWELFAADMDSGTFPQTTDGLQYVGCRHESLAVQMAMGYTILTGQPQVVALHVNVGTLHAAMSIHGAFRNRIPMVLLSSHADTHENELRGGTPGGHYLEFDGPAGHEANYSTYLKWIAHPEHNDNALRYLSRAFRITSSTPRRPVLLNLSRELLYDDSQSEAKIIREVPATDSIPPTEEVRWLVDSLCKAENPLVVAGKMDWSSESRSKLEALADRLKLPVIENPKWIHAFPSEHQYSLGSLSFVSQQLNREVDLVLAIDTKRPWYPPDEGAPDAQRVLISPEPVQEVLSYWNYPFDRLLTGSPVPTLDAILAELPDQNLTPDRPVDWPAEHNALKRYWSKRAAEGRDLKPIDPFWLFDLLDDQLSNEGVIVDETIVHKALVANLLETRQRAFIGAAKVLSSGIGGGFGIALGAKLARPDREVVAIIGDGSYNYNPVPAALGAAVEHDLPILVIIVNNGGYQSQLRSHMNAYPSGQASEAGYAPGTQIEPDPDYASQAEAWGAFGRQVRDPTDLPEAVAAARSATDEGVPALLDVIVKKEPPTVRWDDVQTNASQE